MYLHSKVYPSYVNGPGKRFVIWTQGCTKACKNCFNPSTWPLLGDEISIDELFDEIKKSKCDGLTLTGGDPLEQPDELLKLVKKVFDLNLPKGIILFTGFTLKEIETIGKETFEVLKYIDLLIDGRYEDKLRIENGLKGSSNQNMIHLTNKIKNEKFEIDHQIEIGFTNEIYLTGFPYIDKKFLKKFGIITK